MAKEADAAATTSHRMAEPGENGSKTVEPEVIDVVRDQSSESEFDVTPGSESAWALSTYLLNASSCAPVF